MSRKAECACNPSAWSRRVPVVALALAGCALATYLTLYQWHATSRVWDPAFGTGSSESVLTSRISRLLPLPDATLGGAAYLVEALVAGLGSSDRWRMSPWVVLLYGAVVVALAVTSLFLVLAQALIIRHFCLLCLISASLSFVNAGLARDEVWRTAERFLRKAYAADEPLWRALLGQGHGA